MTYSQIEKKAMELFKAHGEKIPVPVVLIAKSLDITILDVNMPDFRGEIPSGVLSETDDYGWTILLKTDDVLTRKRFTIAHEIGHFLLHRDEYFIDSFSAGETFYRTSESDELEKEANYFAACLLMPAKEVKQRWAHVSSPAELATVFQVSEVSMTFRLKNLKLIE